MTNERKTVSNADFFRWVENELATAGSVRIRVRGCSMYPLLRDGIDEVTLHRYGNNATGGSKPAGLRKGQIVLFRYRGSHILHRIQRLNGNMLTLRGDNVSGHKELCHLMDVVGVVTSVHRKKVRNNTFADISPESAIWRLTAIVRRAAKYHGIRSMIRHR